MAFGDRKRKTSEEAVSSYGTVINGVKIPNIVQYCYDSIERSRLDKDDNVPRGYDYGDDVYDYPGYLSMLSDWAHGVRALPDWAEPQNADEDVAASENHIWTNLQTLKSAIDEKTFTLDHGTEGVEDSADKTGIVSAVRKQSWFMDKMPEIFKSLMYDAMWRSTTVCAVHQSFFDSEPDGRARIFKIDPLAIYWEPRKKIEDANWIEYSFLMPVPEIEYEFNRKLKKVTLENEDKYSLAEYRRKQYGGKTRTQQLNKYGVEQARIHFMWINDTTTVRKQIPEMKIELVPMTERVQRPAVDEEGNLIPRATAGVSEEAKYITIQGAMGVYEEDIVIPDLDGNPQTVETLVPVLDENGKAVTKSRVVRKYPDGRLIVFVNNKVLYDGESIYNLEFLRYAADEKKFPVPIFVINAHETPDSILGRSHIEVMLAMQQEINIAESQIRENARVAGNSPIIVEENAVVYPEIDKNLESLDLRSSNTIVMSANKLDRITRLNQAALPQQQIMRKEAAVVAMNDSVGINEMLIRGIAKATDPAQKTEFLTSLALRRAIPFFASAMRAMLRCEEIRMSLYYQYNKIPVLETISIGGEEQNVDFSADMLEGFHAETRIRIEDNSDTRRERQGAQLARFIEQAGAVLAVDPAIPIALTNMLLDTLDIPGFNEELEKAREMLAQNQPAEGEQQTGDNRIVPIQKGQSG